MSQPVPYRPPGDLWSQFSADPRSMPTFRASDADRDVVVGALATAYQDGRLDAAEHQTRLEQALSLKRLGDVVPLVSDIAAGSVAQAQPAPFVPRRRARGNMDRLRSLLVVTLITNIIWAVTAISSAQVYYYWPIWPMIGVGIPLLISVIFGNRSDRHPGPGAIERRRER